MLFSLALYSICLLHSNYCQPYVTSKICRNTLQNVKCQRSINFAQRFAYYSSIILNSFCYLLFSKLCQHNLSRPTTDSEEYDNIGLETIDSDKKDLTIITHINEDSESVVSRYPPPKVANSNSFCKKWSTSVISALIIIILFVAMAALCLSIFNLVRPENLSTSAAKAAQHTQIHTDLIVQNLTSRVMQLEMLLKEANVKLDEIHARLELSNDAIVELNSSHIPTLETKLDLLDDKLKANVTTLKNELNKTATNVSLLSDQVSQSQTVSHSQFTSLHTELNTITSNVSVLSASQLRTQIQLAAQDARLNATVNETDSLLYQVSNMQSVLTATQSQVTQLDSRHNVTATTVSALSTQIFSLKSTQALALSNLTALDARHSTTVAIVNNLISQVSVLQMSVQTVNSSVLSAVAAQESKLNATITSLDQLVYLFSNLQKVVELINETSSILQLELLSLDEKFETRLNGTLIFVSSLSSQILYFQSVLNLTMINVTSLSNQISLIQNNTLTRSELSSLSTTLNMTATLLTSQISNLQTMLASVQTDLSSLVVRYNVSVNSITSQVNVLLSNINAVNNQLSTARNDITSLTSRTTTLETSVSTFNSGQGSIRNDLTTLQSTVSSFATQLSTLTTRVANINSSTRATAYTHCVKDITICDIVRHVTNRYWYRCTTTYRLINVTGYYTLSTHCQRDPDEIYIDSAYLEISGGYVRCHCDIVGITAGGSHAGIFDPIPTGHCSMVITRCPMLPNTIT